MKNIYRGFITSNVTTAKSVKQTFFDLSNGSICYFSLIIFIVHATC